jgi:hypothetical protein
MLHGGFFSFMFGFVCLLCFVKQKIAADTTKSVATPSPSPIGCVYTENKFSNKSVY